jgi:hypothetical protein
VGEFDVLAVNCFTFEDKWHFAEGATRKPKAMERKDLTVGEQKRSLTYCQQDRANENTPTIVSNSSRKSTKLLPIVIFHSDN